MVFSSNLFLFFFLPLVLAAYYLCPARFRPHLLTVFGLFFYGWSNPLFVFLMLFTTSVDYIAGVMMAQGVPGAATSDTVYPALPAVGERTPAQKAALFISISCNLGLLGFFKYFNFGIEAMQQLAGAFGMTALAQGPVLHVALPLGISFYTFQSMSYTIDVYRGHVAALKNFPLFISYVTMFPQLVAGPIIRFRDVNDQILRRTHTMEKFTRGIAFFSIGLAKKVILGNPCGRIADTCFDAASLSTLEAWTGMLAYSLQIYFDFSGYSDMAVGLGLMIGFILPKNFNSPYRSLGVTDFWRRWHITLSTWLRDYLYVTLGGNRKGPVRTYVNLFLVMLLGGLWHGASWNFIIWGGAHGLWLAAERFFSQRMTWRLPSALTMALTFIGVSLLWVPFRATTLESTGRYFASLFLMGNEGTALVWPAISSVYLSGSLLLAAVIAFFGPQSWSLTRQLTATKAVFVMLLFALSAALLASQSYNPFIYFNF
ncbi:MAG: MBOAT family O-acyltransferase [Prosthecobacter sp.]